MNSKLEDLHLTLSVIRLNVDGLNSLIKSQRLVKCIKYDPILCCQQVTHSRFKDTNRLKVRGWKKMYYFNSDQNIIVVTTLLAYKNRMTTLLA